MTYKLGEYLRELRGKESLRDVSSRIGNKLSHSYISDVEKGVNRRGKELRPSPETLQILADAYNADYEYLMKLAGYLNDDRKREPYYALNEKDKKSIAKTLQEMIDDLSGAGALSFSKEDGELDDETKEALIRSLENSLYIAKIEAKKRYTPKKYRGDDSK